jgi:hypothetical protein
VLETEVSRFSPAGGRYLVERGGLDAFDVALTFGDVNHVGAAVDRGAHFGQPVDDAAHTFEVPLPSAVPVRSALPKVFRREPDALVEQLPVLVGVVVDRQNLLLRPFSFGGKNADSGRSSAAAMSVNVQPSPA